MFEQEGGTTEFTNGNLSILGDILVSGGLFELTAMALSTSGDFELDGGTVLLDQGSASISGQLLVSQGIFTLLTDLSATGGIEIAPQGEMHAFGADIYGNVHNAGLFAPVGTVTISGNFTQSTTGTLRINLGEFANDRLNVTGHASLAGALDVLLDSGFDPEVEDMFVLLEYGSRTGTFDDYLLPTLTNGDWEWWYDVGTPFTFLLEVVN